MREEMERAKDEAARHYAESNAKQADNRAYRTEALGRNTAGMASGAIAGGVGLAAECDRMTGKAALMETVWRIRRQADLLEALARAIPDNFPRDADSGMWELVQAAIPRR